MSDLQKAYREALARLQKSYSKEGNLDSLLAVKRESEKFAESPVIPSAPDGKALDRVQSLQAALIRKAAEAKRRRSTSLIALTDLYDDALEDMQKDLTRQHKIEDALAVKEERNRVTESERVKAAYELAAESEPKPSAVLGETAQSVPGAGGTLPLPLVWLKCEGLEDGHVPDRSAHGNHALPYKVDKSDFVSVGRGNRALKLSHNYLRIPSNPSLQLGRKNHTLSLWCEPEEPKGSNQGLITKWYSYTDKEYGFQLSEEGRIYVILERANSKNTAYSDRQLEAGKWYHIVVTCNAGKVEKMQAGALKIYINGEQVSVEEELTGVLPADDDTEVQIGHFFSPAYSRYFRGLVDDIRIYDRELTAEQVLRLWNDPPSREMKR